MNFLINRYLIWHVQPAQVKAWQETGGTLKLGNWGTSDGTVPRDYPWAWGAERKQLPEAREGSLWEGSPDRILSVQRWQQIQAAEEDVSQVLPMILISRAQPEARALGHTWSAPRGTERGTRVESGPGEANWGQRAVKKCVNNFNSDCSVREHLFFRIPI